MWDILSLATKSLGSMRIYIVFIIAMAASLGWGYYEKDRADGLEAQVTDLTQQVRSVQTIDEMNKSTARANEQLLSGAIAKQNDMFQKLADQQTQQAQTVIDSLNKNQASTAAQYNKVSLAIGKIQIQSCDGMVNELIKFPDKLGSVGSTK